MKNLLFSINIITMILACTHLSIAQECLFGHIEPELSKNPNTTYASQFGWYVPASGNLRILIVFGEIEYINGGDPTNPNGSTGWPAHSLPTWANALAEPIVPSGNAQGVITRYFQMASSGNFNVLGDYLLAPDNGGIFKVSYNGTVLPDPRYTNINSLLSSEVNAKLNNQIITGHNLNSINYFDLWSIPSSLGTQKTTPSAENPRKYDAVMFIWRNCKFNGTGYGSNSFSGSILGYGSNSFSCFGTYENIPTQIMIHEFSHGIYGGNNFHCGGGGWNEFGGGDYFIPYIGGWSNLGLSEASLLTWNAWDRQRLDWKAQGNSYSVSARNSINSSEINGDLDATNPTQAGIYTLRDFATTGDAIRVKLPFLNPATEYPEFLWIENHNTVGMNQCPFDKFHYQDGNSCVIPAVYGLYSYLQIDREIRSSTISNEVFGGYAYYLRPLTANGFYDRFYDVDSVQNNCVNWDKKRAFILASDNPLTGGGDQEAYSFNRNGNNTLEYSDIIENYIEKKNGTYYKNLFAPGHARHSFTQSGNRKIGIGTNPSSATMMNMVGHNYPGPSSAKNVRKVSLNGVSVEIINQNTDGTMQVQIRFDDIEVNNNIRWCADTIVLNPISSPSGYSLNLLSAKTITLDQSTTDTKMNNPITFNGKQIFSSPTIFKCRNNSWFNMSVNSNMVLLNQSSLILESGSRIDINDGSTITINTGCTLYIKSGANLNINGSGKIEIKPGAFICIETGSTINLSSFNSVINLRPDYINGVNPSLGITSNCVASPATYATTGSGKINTYLSDIFIQNETLTGNRYVSGNTISAGTNVTPTKPQGPVVVKSGSNTVLDAEGNIVLDKGFEVESGALFEAK